MLYECDVFWVLQLEKECGDVKFVVIGWNLYYFGIEPILPVASCATGGGEGVRRVGFIEK